MLKDALQTLSAAPTAQEKKQALATVNMRITTLESQLGIKARLMPILNSARAAARLAELQGQIASKGIAPAAAVSPAPVARPVEPSGAATLDRAIAASGTHNLRTFKLKTRRDQLVAAVAHQPAGSIARKCAESNLQKAEAELRNS